MAYQYADYRRDVKRSKEKDRDLHQAIHKASGQPLEQVRKFQRTLSPLFGSRHTSTGKNMWSSEREAETKQFKRSVDKLKSLRKISK